MSNLAVLPNEPPHVPHLPPELQPLDLGVKGKVRYLRRLPIPLERVWKAYEEAMRAGGMGRAIPEVARALFAAHAEDHPAHHERHTAEGRWAVLEEGLARELRRGLSLKLACAMVGVPLERVQSRCKTDHELRERLDGYRRVGVARVHGFLLERAKAGSDTAIIKALEYSGEDEYTPRQRTGAIREDDIRDHPTFRKFVQWVGSMVCEGCRERLREEMGG